LIAAAGFGGDDKTADEIVRAELAKVKLERRIPMEGVC